jgi:hypothetical protein
MQVDINTLATEGARVRLQQIKAEMMEIYDLFPGINGITAKAVAGIFDTPLQLQRASGTQKHARGWTDAKRKAASERMRAYWAKRRSEKASRKRGKPNATQ